MNGAADCCWGQVSVGPLRSFLEGLGDSQAPGSCRCGQNSTPGVSGRMPPHPSWQPSEASSQLLEASHSPQPTAALLHPQSQRGRVESSHSGCPAPSSAESEASHPHEGLVRPDAQQFPSAEAQLSPTSESPSPCAVASAHVPAT